MEQVKMHKYYLTFGCGQPNRGNYMIIEAESEEDARNIVFQRFGSTWAFLYHESEWFKDGISQAERYNYNLMV